MLHRYILNANSNSLNF